MPSSPAILAETTLAAARSAYRALDIELPPEMSGIRVIAGPDFDPVDDPAVVRIGVPGWSGEPGANGLFADIRFAFHALLATGSGEVYLGNGGQRGTLLAMLLNSFLGRRRRTIVLFDTFVETPNAMRRKLIGRLFRAGCDAAIVYGSKMTKRFAEYLDVPESRFIFIPYQADHSKRPPLARPGEGGDYIFGGGNSKRDYATLCEAVRGLDIPVTVATSLPPPPIPPTNVKWVRATPPEFAHLMAGSRFCVNCIQKGGTLRGHGETSIANAMWHGKPVVATDDISAADYIQEGVTGYVVPSGDAAALRSRIQDLWADPGKTRQMGERAQEYARLNFSHARTHVRWLNLARLCAAARSLRPVGS
jgi:hypothetical protein